MNEDKKEVVQESEVQGQPNISHRLKITNGQIELDGFKLKNVTMYNLNQVEPRIAELTLKIVIISSNVLVGQEVPVKESSQKLTSETDIVNIEVVSNLSECIELTEKARELATELALIIQAVNNFKIEIGTK